jgi:hypothetical protein
MHMGTVSLGEHERSSEMNSFFRCITVSTCQFRIPVRKIGQNTDEMVFVVSPIRKSGLFTDKVSEPVRNLPGRGGWVSLCPFPLR